jgi:hypothetical protein
MPRENLQKKYHSGGAANARFQPTKILKTKNKRHTPHAAHTFTHKHKKQRTR